jgi:polyisoprenoid-binding protein YceI
MRLASCVARGACLAACFALTALTANAEPAVYRVQPAQTIVEFSIIHLGVFRAEGRFTRVTGRILYDPAVPSGNVDIDIASKSVATGWGTRDAFLRGEAMFDAEHHPEVRFRSTRMEFAGGKLMRVDGELTLRGVTRPISLAVTRMECGTEANPGRDACDAEAETTLRRREFDMDFAWPLIGDEVGLRFLIRAIRE